MIYGDKPKDLGVIDIDCHEMMFYQYLPIKLEKQIHPKIEDRLKCFEPLIGAACCDFIADFGLIKYTECYVYLTAKHMFQGGSNSFNRMGYHSDGFMTDDINYLWSNSSPTIFNISRFNLTQDDIISMDEMEIQAKKENEFQYPEKSLLRLNQFVIHKVNPVQKEGIRTFVKISFSNDKYDLIGNAHNYLLDYNWNMRNRKNTRNIPQKLNK